MHSPFPSASSTEAPDLLVVRADMTRAMAAHEAAHELPAQAVVVDCSAHIAKGPVLARHLARDVQEIGTIAPADGGAEFTPSAVRSEWLDRQIGWRAASGEAAG